MNQALFYVNNNIILYCIISAKIGHYITVHHTVNNKILLCVF